MPNRSTVFIPVVSPKGALPNGDGPRQWPVGRFIEIYVEAYRFGEDTSDTPPAETALLQERTRYDRKAIDKCWDRVAAPLRKNSPALYQSGCVAANAIRKLNFKYRSFALFQFLKPNAVIETKRLHSVTAWWPTEGRSAELWTCVGIGHQYLWYR